MTRVVLIGQPYWANHLTSLISAHSDLDCTAVNGARLFTPKALHAVAGADVLLRIGFRPAATTLRGLLFDAQWDLMRSLNPRVKAAFYWIGTDVLHTLEDMHAGRLLAPRWERAKMDAHFVGAPWFVEELKEAGLSSKCFLFPGVFPDPPAALDLPAALSVLTYIPDNRYVFYGGEMIARAAEALPNVPFEVLGGKGHWLGRDLPNLRFHGWQADVRPFLAKTSVLLRLVPHDAVGGTVREALSAARHVIYTLPLPHTRQVAFGDAEGLVEVLAELKASSDEGSLRPNIEGQEYALRVFDSGQNVNALVEGIRKVAEERVR